MDIRELRLSQLKTGEKGQIVSFTDGKMQQKMFEMGCLPGESVSIAHFAPLGCPMAIQVAGSVLSLRLDEADHVIVSIAC